ncbi:MAG: TonB family protein [Sphingomonadaceae bacterium]
MAYLDSSRRASPASMAAVIAIHAGLGVALIAGLTVTGTIIKPKPSGPIIDFPIEPPPPPSPEPQQNAKPQSQQQSHKLVVPIPKIDFGKVTPPIDSTDIIDAPIPEAIPTFTPSPSASATASGFKPVAAAPRNNPANWVSNSDYRSEWARRDWTGRASFRLAISAEGRVTGCTITSSTGHEALDTATCALVAKRARFNPARGKDGEPVGGSYAGTIVWQLPD